jgi:hypothetical protein
VKIKWLYTVYVEAGDVVSLVSVEDGPSFTFHTDVSTISSNNFSANIHYYGYIYILMCVCLCFFFASLGDGDGGLQLDIVGEPPNDV